MNIIAIDEVGKSGANQGFASLPINLKTEAERTKKYYLPLADWLP
jgi:hypothetical protein